ncbi:hypothetical protein GALL_391170 [mine drainage metagenome]|uniref:YhdP central domain-containing protein n=1 Tax=mine drainage metagenome TaxID=410659 RepID=A0A1J5Q6Z1_9ZZZZ
MIKKSLDWLYNAITYLLWTGIIIVAVVVLGMRYFVLPNVQVYKDTLAQQASQTAGQKITIGDIKASWDGLHPHLDLYRVDLYDDQNRSALSLSHVETSLSWLSLVLGEVRLSSIIIHQPKLTVRREADGTIYVAGISLNGPSRPAFPNWLLRQAEVDVLDASLVWQDDLRHAPPLTLEKLNLRLSSPAWGSIIGRHRFGLQATPSVGASQPIDIRGNLLGRDVSHPEKWSGTVYARLEGTDIAAWRAWIDYPFDLREGFGASQFWLNFADGKATKITADVLLHNVHTRFASNAPEAVLRDLSGRLSWQRLQNGQILDAQDLHLATAEGLDMQGGHVQVKTTVANGRKQVAGDVHVDHAILEQITAFSGYLPVSPQLLQALSDIAPKGQLHQLSLGWSGDADNPQQYFLRSNFSGLGINAYHGVPGFSNLNGAINATQAGGTLSLEAKNATLDLKNILRQPIPADSVAGQVKWTRKNGVLDIKLGNFAIANPHIAGTINADYRYAGHGSGEIDLTGKFSRADGKFASYYYPLVLGQSTLHWLDTSVLSGHAEDVSVIVRGNLDEFPWADDKRGLFQVKATLGGGSIDYASGWPRIDDLHLKLLFQGNRMELNADQGHLLGNQIVRARAIIPALNAQHPVLQVSGELQAPGAETIKFINSSPLLAAIDHFTEGLQASGNGRLTLDLGIPLDTAGLGTKVKGSYQLSNGTLSGGSDFPALDHVNGRLDFTESSLRAHNINAQIFGGPAQFSLENGKDGLLRVTAQGRMSDSNIRQALGSPLANKLHGSADWSGRIDLRKHQANLVIKSNLTGLSSSLPPPFDKTSSASLPLRIEKTVQGEQQDLISVSVENVVSARLLRSAQNGAMHIDSGEIAFGTSAETPHQPGISLRGRIEHFDVDQWQALLENSAGGGINISSASLAFGTLDVFDRRINELSLGARSITDGWQTTLKSREINGDVQWLKSGHGKIVARLKSLIIPAAAPAKLSDADAAPRREPDYPALDVVAETFEARQKSLGRLELRANPQGGDWNIEKLLISNPDSTLSADGEWRNWKRRPNTRLNLSWEIKDIGKTLDRFGYPNTIKGGTADLKGRLKWPGSPHEFSVTDLSGDLQLNAAHGQFLKIQPGVGRLFSVLSLQNLPRRLSFDFRDVFSAGFTFDEVNADVRIDRGVMRSDNFTMDGPTAKVAMSGETDLNNETQNLHIKVTPSISDSLSLAAFAGGPAVGAAAWVVQKLLKDPINKLAAYEYDITGTWNDPQEVKSKKDTVAPTPPPTPLGN